MLDEERPAIPSSAFLPYLQFKNCSCSECELRSKCSLLFRETFMSDALTEENRERSLEERIDKVGKD